MRVIAALDSSPAATTVLDVATMFAERVGADVTAVYVRRGAGRAAAHQAVDRLARRRAVPLWVIEGPAAASIVEAGDDDDVAAVVVGARRSVHGKLPVGSTAMAVATTARRPVLVTPPAVRIDGVRRVLVPLEGADDGAALTDVIELLADGGANIVPLHVFMPSTVPSFWDQPHHAAPVWSTGFLARFGPPGADDLWLRCGRIDDAVLDVVERAAIDLIALTWMQDVTGVHAPVVRALLARSPVPVLLVPQASRPAG